MDLFLFFFYVQLVHCSLCEQKDCQLLILAIGVHVQSRRKDHCIYQNTKKTKGKKEREKKKEKLEQTSLKLAVGMMLMEKFRASAMAVSAQQSIPEQRMVSFPSGNVTTFSIHLGINACDVTFTWAPQKLVEGMRWINIQI